MTDITDAMNDETKSTSALRLLVTGSRDWTDRDAINDALWDWLIENGFTAKTSKGLPKPILVVGACKTGADLIAEELWRSWGYPVERHPADWDRLGRSAGPERNKEMVRSGAAGCLAFPKGLSYGTRGCMKLADVAGIPVIVFEAADHEGRHVPFYANCSPRTAA